MQNIRGIFISDKSNGAVLGKQVTILMKQGRLLPPKKGKKHCVHNELTEVKRAKRKYTPTRS